MLNHEEKILLARKKKKILLISVLIVIGVFMLTGVTLVILSAVRHHVWDRNIPETHANPIQRRFIHPDPDWYRNIFDDSIYMSLDLNIRFTDGLVTTIMDADNVRTFPAAAQFMYEVVYMIMHGDYEGYNNIFADEYWENSRPEDWRLAFPMQPLFNIEIRLLGSTADTVDVMLSYMIYRNDGMFRPDLPYNEEAIKPVIYRLRMGRDGEIQVTHKMPYMFIGQGAFMP